MREYNRRFSKLETRNEVSNESPYFWDYYDDVNEFRFGYYDDPLNVHYEYLNSTDGEVSYIKRGLVRQKHFRNNAILQIDMMSIYSKEMLRQKKIDMILDDIQDLSNTIENLIQFSSQGKSCSKA